VAGIMGASFTTATAYIADISLPRTAGPQLRHDRGRLWSGLHHRAADGRRARAVRLPGALHGFGRTYPAQLVVRAAGTARIAGPRKPAALQLARANPAGSLAQLRKYPVITGLIGSLLFVYLAGYATQSTWTYLPWSGSGGTKPGWATHWPSWG
jgi:DHA1 family tetracycline resistance protein-like MFS transporter